MQAHGSRAFEGFISRRLSSICAIELEGQGFLLINVSVGICCFGLVGFVSSVSLFSKGGSVSFSRLALHVVAGV